MMSDIKSQAKSSRNSKLHALGGKGTVGKQLSTGAGSTWNGVAGVDSGQLADEQKIKTRKDGGRVGGAKMKSRLDRKAAKNDHDEDDGYNRGGRVERASGGKVGGKGRTNITIVMAPGQGGQPQAPQAVPVPRPIPVPIQAPPPGAAPPMGAGAPPMAPPVAGPPPGMGRKRGGRVGKSGGGESGPGSMVSDYGLDENLKDYRHRRQQSEATTPDVDYVDRDSSSTNYPSAGGSDATPTRMTSTPRKRAGGGKITAGKGLGMTAGSRSGSGRLQKIAIQKKSYP